MRKLLALWRREFIEHRGAYFWAPLIILGVVMLTVISIIARARFELPPEALLLPPRRLYEDAVLIGVALWWLYFAAALIFYLADAFSADRRNNAMLFWKSMPVSDFGMLMSKITYGMGVSALLAAVYAAGTGIVLAVLILIINVVLPTMTPPPVAEVASSLGSLVLFAAGYAALSVLWYAPVLAWVSTLSALVRRWSIPLAIAVPSALVMMEVSIFRTNHIGGYLAERLSFGMDWQVLLALFYTLVPLNGVDLLAIVLLGIDWVQFAGGIVLALALVYLASRWRKRGIAS